MIVILFNVVCKQLKRWHVYGQLPKNEDQSDYT